MVKRKFVGILKAVKPADDIRRPAVELAEQRLTAHMGPVDFYNLVVPRGSLIYVIVGVGRYCIEVNYEDEKYYFMISELGLTDPDVIEEVPPELCRPRY